jgi:hypothetical protein
LYLSAGQIHFLVDDLFGQFLVCLTFWLTICSGNFWFVCFVYLIWTGS